jgi:hypothetical protein
MSPQFRRIAIGIALCVAPTVIQSDVAMADEVPVFTWGWAPTEQVATTTAAEIAPGTVVVGVPISRRMPRRRMAGRFGATRPNAGGYYYTTDGYRVFLVGPGNRVLVNGINVGDVYP